MPRVRALIAAFGSRGDVQPLLALALGLRARGHTVELATPPDFAAWIAELGLPCHPVGGSMREFLERSNEGLRGIAYALRELPRLVALQYAALEPLARRCDVMLGSSLTAAGASFAEKLPLRYHYVSFTPCVLPSAEHPSLFTKSQSLPRWLNRLGWWQYRLMNNLGLRPTIDAERRKLGLGGVSDAWRHLLHTRLILACDPALGPLPRDAPPGVIQMGSWFLPEREELPADLETFLDAGPPPLYVGFGSTPDRDPGSTWRKLIASIREAGVRALLAGAPTDLELPVGMRTIGAAPHGKLFPRCAGVVHHGGAGTTATAARAGVPQIVAPQMTDQFYWRRRLEERGLTPLRATARHSDELPRAMRACLDDGALRERARAFASRMIPDGVERAVRELEAEDAQGAR